MQWFWKTVGPCLSEMNNASPTALLPLLPSMGTGNTHKRARHVTICSSQTPETAAQGQPEVYDQGGPVMLAGLLD